MNVAALVFALAGAALNLFQDVAIVPFVGGVSMLKIVQLMMKIGSDPYGGGGNNFGDLFSQVIRTPQGLALVGTIVAPIIALIGGIFAFRKQKKFLGSVLLGICALSCGIVFLTIHTNLSRASYETRMMANIFTSSENLLIWAVLYGGRHWFRFLVSEAAVR